MKSPDVIFGETERATWVPMLVSVNTGTSTLQPITGGVKTNQLLAILESCIYIYIYILCAIHTICFLQNAPFYLLPKSKRAVLRSFSSNAVVLLCFYLPPHSRPLWDEGPMAQVLSFGLRIRCSDARRTSSKPLKVAKTRPNTAIPTRSTGKLGLLCLGSEKMREKGNGLVKKIYLRFG